MGRLLGPILFVLMGLVSCTYSPRNLVKPEPRAIGGAYRVDPQIAWSRIAAFNRMELWTVDGPDLEALRLYYGVQDGDTLLPTRREQRLPTYEAGMKPHDVVELVLASLARIGSSQVTASGLQPASFGDLPGFRFDLDFHSPQGLEYKGLAVGTVAGGGGLHLILYTGAQIHYFPKHRDAVERLIASVELP